MDSEILKVRIGSNIAAYRKRGGLTQAGLAEKLNYTDRAVSKWERGESIPDVLTLMQLAELFEIEVGELLADPNELPGDPGKLEKAMTQVSEKALRRKADKSIIQRLCSILVWFVATLVFVIVSSLDIPKSWIMFFYAVPANAIVLLSLRSAWHDFRWNRGLISVIMWGSILSIYMTLLVFFGLNIWKLFLLGIPGQAAIILWFRMYRIPKNKEENDG